MPFPERVQRQLYPQLQPRLCYRVLQLFSDSFFYSRSSYQNFEPFGAITCA